MRKYFILIMVVLLVTACSNEKVQYNSVAEKNNSINNFYEYSQYSWGYNIRIARSYVETKAAGRKAALIKHMNEFFDNPDNEYSQVESPVYFGITNNGRVITLIATYSGCEPIWYKEEIDDFRGINNEFDILKGTAVFYGINKVSIIWVFDVYIDSVKQEKYKCDIIMNEEYKASDINKAENADEKKKKQDTIKKYTETYDFEYKNNRSVKSNEWNYFLVEISDNSDPDLAFRINALELNLDGEKVKMYHASEIMNMP